MAVANGSMTRKYNPS